MGIAQAENSGPGRAGADLGFGGIAAETQVRIAGFVEGAWPPQGGLGLVAVPRIFESIAERGHEATLLVGGRVPEAARTSPRGGANSSGQNNGMPRGLRIITFRSATKWAFSLPMAASAIKAVKQSDLVSLHSLYSFPVLLGFILARCYRRPYIFWPLGVLAPFQRQVGRRKKWLYDRLFAGRILRSASAIAYTAAGERAEAASCTPDVPSLVIPHGLDIESFAELPPRGAFRAAYLSGFQGPVVLYLGRLNAKKGLDILVEAFAKLVPRFHGDIRLAIVGPPDPPAFGSALQAMIRSAGIESQTVVTGPINGLPEKLQALVDGDCFALPSIAENFCFALFEAMACRRPVVVSETINFAAKVVAYGAGVAVRRDAERFADAIEAVLRDPARQNAMGDGGRRLAEAYSWPACGERLDRAIQCIAGRRPFPADLTND
jgi:glycosyltransferase involved in cell wall biosynthesis